MRMVLIVGDWGDDLEGPDTEWFDVEVTPPAMTDDEIIKGYEVENSPERKKLDDWAEKHVYPQVMQTERKDPETGWISVYFSSPETFVLYDCEYNFHSETGKVVGS